MDRFSRAVAKISRAMQWVGGCTLAAMMLITLADIILRRFGHPVPGTFEIISFLGGIVAGFAIPSASLAKSHVFVDFVLNRMSPAHKSMLKATTRIMAVFVFGILTYFLISMAANLHARGEVTMTCKLPFYPIAAGIGLACFVEVLVLITEVFDGVKGGNS